MANNDHEASLRGRAGAATAWIQSGAPFTLATYEAGSLVLIDLIGERMGDIQVEPDQTLAGRLVDAHQSIIRVSAATHQTDLVGHEIGLATRTALMTPAGIAVEATLCHVVAAGREMAHYFPADVPENSKYGLPAEYNYPMVSYGRLQVAEHVIFDVIGQRQGR